MRMMACMVHLSHVLWICWRPAHECFLLGLLHVSLATTTRFDEVSHMSTATGQALALRPSLASDSWSVTSRKPTRWHVLPLSLRKLQSLHGCARRRILTCRQLENVIFGLPTLGPSGTRGTTLRSCQATIWLLVLHVKGFTAELASAAVHLRSAKKPLLARILS